MCCNAFPTPDPSLNSASTHHPTSSETTRAVSEAPSSFVGVVLVVAANAVLAVVVVAADVVAVADVCLDGVVFITVVAADVVVVVVADVGLDDVILLLMSVLAMLLPFYFISLRDGEACLFSVIRILRWSLKLIT